MRELLRILRVPVRTAELQVHFLEVLALSHYISRTSPLYLPYISLISPLHLPCISLEVLAALAEWNQGLDLPNGAERVRTTLRLAWARRLPQLQPLTFNPNPSP